MGTLLFMGLSDQAHSIMTCETRDSNVLDLSGNCVLEVTACILVFMFRIICLDENEAVSVSWSAPSQDFSQDHKVRDLWQLSVPSYNYKLFTVVMTTSHPSHLKQTSLFRGKCYLVSAGKL